MPAKVSVIVPVYNSEAYLARCLDTLVNQTLQEIEILVVNDGSPDDSQAIIDRYAAEYPEKIVPLVKENGGLSDARNFGVARATGEYLGFVDSDDWVDLDMYEQLHARASLAQSDVVVHPITYAFSTKYLRNYFTKVQELFGKSVAESPRLLIYANSFAVNKIYRREFWLDGGFQFPVGQAFEDSAVIYNILYAANRVDLVNIPFYFYERARDESITNSADQHIHDIFKSCESVLTYYRRQPDYEAMKDVVEYVCLKHIFVRFNVLAGSDDRRFIRKFLNAAYYFLNDNIPDWQENFYFDKKRMSRLTTMAVRHLRSRPALSKLYYTSPRLLRRMPRRARRLASTVRSKARSLLTRRSRERRAEAIKVSKSANLQAQGYQLLTVVQTLLQREGIASFADFGTLLGLIREGHLLYHDLDLDIGVLITDEIDVHRTRIAMERFGFRVWREYYKGEEMVESSFRLLGIKVDLNYYRVDETSAKTWLFYRDPAKKYGPRDRDIVEMRYSPIRELTTLEAEGTRVWVPANAEQLLAEKYGPTWRVPDKDWVYWESPAATPIEDEGRFVTYHYPGGFTRSGDAENEQLYERLYRHEIVPSASADAEMAQVHRLQQLELSILREVDRICRENDITYYLAEGTLLGAVRHGGFIPWDDDIDIAMPRDDYDRFLQLAPGLIDARFEVQHWTLTPKYWSIFAKVRLLDTSEFYQPPIAHLTKNNGPYIDIFPLDSVPEQTSPQQNHQKTLMTRWRKALSYKRGDTRPKTTKTKLIRLRTLFHSIPGLYRRIDETYRMFEKPSNHFWVSLASYYSASRETFPIEWYGTPKYVKFVDGEFPVPAEAEAMLESIYGPSYTVMPEIEMRKIKHSMVYRLAEDAEAETPQG